NLPQAELATRLNEVPRDRPLYLICQGGFRSLRAARFLSQMGFKDVASVIGGTEGWWAAKKSLALGDTDSQPQPFVESEWAHAGLLSYEIGLAVAPGIGPGNHLRVESARRSDRPKQPRMSLRASVGSTEASASLPARVGVVGPTRARPLQGQAR